MLTISVPISARQAGEYYTRDYAAAEYYTDRTEGWWHGRTAAMLGLGEDVEERQFRALLDGRHPETGEQLVAAQAATGDRRAAFDLTFSAPKSVSLLAETVAPELRAGHERAVREALDMLEEYVETRRHGGTEWVRTENFAVAGFTHDTSRALDPQLHSHAVVLNLTRREEDGAWRAIDPAELYRSQRLGTAVYRAALAREAVALGFELESRGRGKFEIGGVTRETIEAFSTRAREIQAFVDERGLDGAGARQVAAHQTREAKREVNPELVRERWSRVARETGTDLERLRAEARARVAPQDAEAADAARRRDARGAVNFAIRHVFERDVVADRRDLVTAALEYAPAAGLTMVREEIGRQAAAGALLAAAGREDAYTTREAVEREAETIRMMRSAQDTHEPLAVTPRAVPALDEERQRVVDHVLHARDGVVGIEGRAGVGKTEALREVRERLGPADEVRGFAPTTAATLRLQQTGIRSQTLASLLASREPSPAPSRARRLWIVDEASMVSSRDMHELLRRREAAGARLVLVGDTRQHHAVAAGDAFRQLREAGMRTEEMRTIHRQVDPELRRAVQAAADGRAAEAIRRLDATGRVEVVADRAARHRAAAEVYVRSRQRDSERTILAVAPTHAERRELNAEVRAGLQRAGLVAAEGRGITIRVPRDLTAAERTWAGAYEPGDRVVVRERGRDHEYEVLAVDRERHTLTLASERGIETRRADTLERAEVYALERREVAVGDELVFTRRDPARGIANGMTGRVEDFDGAVARVRLEDGRQTILNLERELHVEHGYARTSHSAQGLTFDEVLVVADTRLSGRALSDRMFYVAISRAREDGRVFADDRERLLERAERASVRSTALEVAPPDGTERLPDRPPGAAGQAWHRGYAAGLEQGWRESERQAGAAARGEGADRIYEVLAQAREARETELAGRSAEYREAVEAGRAEGQARFAASQEAVAPERGRGAAQEAGAPRAAAAARGAAAAREPGQPGERASGAAHDVAREPGRAPSAGQGPERPSAPAREPAREPARDDDFGYSR